jgi:hypothetical protein
MSEQLTEQQIENWRNVLSDKFGPYALIMSREQIQTHRDKIQEVIGDVECEED